MTSSATRKICYGAQNIVRYLLETAYYDAKIGELCGLLQMLRLYVLISRIMRLFKTSFAHAATMPGGFGKVVSIQSSRVLSRLICQRLFPHMLLISPICSSIHILSWGSSFCRPQFVWSGAFLILNWRLGYWTRIIHRSPLLKSSHLFNSSYQRYVRIVCCFS